MRAMTWLGGLVAIGLVACGTPGDDLVPAPDLVVVAHQDDDLLFMQPDLTEAVVAGAGVTTVYVTAGDATRGVAYATSRQTAVMAAYAAAAGEADWQCSWITIAGHAARHCRLDGARVSLVFLGYPDGGIQGNYPNSLLDMWRGTVGSAETVAEQTTRYDRDGLIDTLAEVIGRTRPRTIRTLDVAADHGGDHTDHELVAALALLAAGRASTDAELLSFRGYDTVVEPVNKPDALFAATFDLFAHYEACQSVCAAACGSGTCDPSTISPGYVQWAHRRYAIGFRSRLAGKLRVAGRRFESPCALAGATVGACGDAPTWQLTGHAIRGTSGCLAVESDGQVAVRPCDGGLDQRFFADDEGHLWSAVPPPMVYAAGDSHLRCLSRDGGVLRADLCNRDALWTFERPLVTTAMTAMGISARGRDVRIADIDGDGRGDLCAVEHAALVCAHGDGSGGFGAAVEIASGFAIDPDSLALGDIDGDGRADAYGLAVDGSGLIAATAANGYVPAPWSSVFGATAMARAVAGTAASLAVAPQPGRVQAVCGLSAVGLSCAGGQLEVLSTLPKPGDVVWTGNLDDDAGADWCGAGSAGIACRPWGELGVPPTDVVPWSYSLGGTIEDVPDSYAGGGLADIDGDGRDDMCALAKRRSRRVHAQPGPWLSGPARGRRCSTCRTRSRRPRCGSAI